MHIYYCYKLPSINTKINRMSSSSIVPQVGNHFLPEIELKDKCNDDIFAVRPTRTRNK